MAEQSKQHAMEMHQQPDKAHLKAMAEMSELMQGPAASQQWVNLKKKQFDSLQDK